MKQPRSFPVARKREKLGSTLMQSLGQSGLVGTGNSDIPRNISYHEVPKRFSSSLPLCCRQDDMKPMKPTWETHMESARFHRFSPNDADGSKLCSASGGLCSTGQGGTALGVTSWVQGYNPRSFMSWSFRWSS